MRHFTLALISIASLSILGCSGASSTTSGNSASKSKVAMTYSNGSSKGGLNVRQIQTSDDTQLGLFFGTVGVDAYYYRPGAGSVNNLSTSLASNNIDSSDWSEWNMLPYNGIATDLAMPTGGQLDINALAGDYFLASMTSAYQSGVSVFSFDFMFIQGLPNLIMPDNTICGGNDYWNIISQVAPLFPQYSMINDSGQSCDKLALYNGHPMEGVNYIFSLIARKDWFPIPVVLTVQTGFTGNQQCWTSDSTLSAFQIEVIDSLMSQETKTSQGVASYWPTGNYSTSACTFTTGEGNPVDILIAPMSTDTPIVQFVDNTQPETPTLSPLGNTIPQSGSTNFGSTLAANVSFNLTTADITNWSVVSNAADYYGCTTGDCTTTFGEETIELAAASNGVPWGLTVDFEVTTPPVVPSPTPTPTP